MFLAEIFEDDRERIDLVQELTGLCLFPTAEFEAFFVLSGIGRNGKSTYLQILRNLVTHGILHSTRGVVGGYVLDRNLDDVSLLDIIEAIEGPITSSIPSTAGLPDLAQARLGEAMASVTENVRRELAAIKLSQLRTPPPALK
jgi:hypothetical protein